MRSFCIILFLAAAMVGCATWSGSVWRRSTRTEITDPSGQKQVITKEETQVKLPKGVKDPSSIKIDGMEATISSVYKPKAADPVMGALGDKSFYASIVCVVLAGACLYLRVSKFPLIPSYAPVGLGGLAVAFYCAPVILDRYSWQIGLIGLGLIAWCVYGYRHNRKLKDQPVEMIDDAT